MMTDREAMERAVRLAWRGWGRTGANPMVGAVVLRDGEVVGEGFHAEFGGPHAEVVALNEAGARARGGDLIVTLEPCRHHGKTPPCIESIISHGIRRVVFATADVDPKARGGALHLRTAGVRVDHGLCADDVQRQNALFFHRYKPTGRPFVALKLAMSLDARIADHARRSQWVTGEEARAFVHWLRAGFDAIGAGLGTVIADDPQLTPRGAIVPLAPPLRVVFDNRAETPATAAVVKTARATPTVVLAATNAPAARADALRRLGVDVMQADGLAAQLGLLAKRGVNGLLVEGGGILAGRLLAEHLVDRLLLIQAPFLLGSRGVPAFGDLPSADLAQVRRWTVSGRRVLGDDHLTVLDRA